MSLTLVFGAVHGSLLGRYFRHPIHSAYINPVPVRIARVRLIPASNTGKDPVYGELYLKQTSRGVTVEGKINGLETGLHGFHVHEKGDLSNDCKGAGGHFNPQMVSRGGVVVRVSHTQLDCVGSSLKMLKF